MTVSLARRFSWSQIAPYVITQVAAGTLAGECCSSSSSSPARPALARRQSGRRLRDERLRGPFACRPWHRRGPADRDRLTAAFLYVILARPTTRHPKTSLLSRSRLPLTSPQDARGGQQANDHQVVTSRDISSITTCWRRLGNVHHLMLHVRLAALEHVRTASGLPGRRWHALRVSGSVAGSSLEPQRRVRRLQSLRGWSHGRKHVEEVSTRAARAGGPDGRRDCW